MPKQQLEEHYKGPEFSTEADSLLERIRKYREEHGDPTDSESLLKVAILILKERLG